MVPHIPKIVIVTYFIPLDIGHGGNHRSYQIQWDCCQAVGQQNVIVLSWQLWLHAFVNSRRSLSTLRKGIKYIGNRLERFRRAKYNIWKILGATQFSPRLFSHQSFLASYKDIVENNKGPFICILEHPGFYAILDMNTKIGIPTISCLQNIESLDEGPLNFSRKFYIKSRLGDLASELSVLSQCHERLFISKVETGLVGGLGLSARFYPYRPVGAIAQRLDEIHRKRTNCQAVTPDPNLFLMLGSATHRSTRAGLRWFIQNSAMHGLPRDIRLEVVGKGTEQLAGEWRVPPGVRCRGFVSQDELDVLLTSACASLLPQPYGFGALTRLAEFAQAGLPVILSEHARYAVDLPSGVKTVRDDWTSWYTAMEEVRKQGGSNMARHMQRVSSEECSALQEAIGQHF